MYKIYIFISIYLCMNCITKAVPPAVWDFHCTFYNNNRLLRKHSYFYESLSNKIRLQVHNFADVFI